MKLYDNSTILFMGDSVTDCGRQYEDDSHLGYGYPRDFSIHLRLSSPEKHIRVLNRGISGNRVTDLVRRWDADCLAHKPEVLSVLIGINDTWRAFDENNPTSVEDFYDDYRRLMLRFQSACPESKIIILEPFVLPIPEDRELWRVDLDPKIHAVRKIAAEFADEFIPLDGIFASAATKLSPEQLCGDGVHPTDLGHRLIADTLAQTLGI